MKPLKSSRFVAAKGRGPARRALRLAAAAAFAAAAGGCSYESQYAPPRDGRPRAVWSKNEIKVAHAGAPISGVCAGEVLRLTGSGELHLSEPLALSPEHPGAEPRYRLASGGYWVPRYYGPSLVVVSPGAPPLLPYPPLFFVSTGPGLRGRYVPPPAPAGGGGGGANLSGDSGKGLAILAMLALVVLPIIDVSVALTPPEKIGRSSQAIDQVNALNDLLRSDGTPCSYAAAAGGTP